LMIVAPIRSPASAAWSGSRCRHDDDRLDCRSNEHLLHDVIGVVKRDPPRDTTGQPMSALLSTSTC